MALKKLSVLIFLIFAFTAAYSQGQRIPKPKINSETEVTVTSEELNATSGVTGNIQTQLDGTLKSADGVAGYSGTKIDSLLNLKINNADSSVFNTTSHYLCIFRGGTQYIFKPDSVVNSLLTGMYATWTLWGSSPTDTLGVHDLTNSGAVAGGTGKFNQGFTFDTNTDYLYCDFSSSPPSSEVRTISMWINLDILPSTAGYNYTLLGELTSTFASKLSVTISTASNTIAVRTRNNAATNFYSYSATGAISATATWYNIIVITPGVGEAAQVYINGSLSSNGTSETFTGTPYTSDYRFYIGGLASQTNSTDGYISDVTFLNRAATASEIADLSSQPYPFNQ